MKKIVALLIISLFPISAFAAFSAFEVVKPGTDHAKIFEFRVKHTKNLESCTIEFLPFGYDHKHAWLIVSLKPLTEKEQELRGYIWGESQKPASIELIAKLSPMNDGQVIKKNTKDSRYSVTLKTELASRSYVYIDFPYMVFDGGFYYSIPLGDYCGYRN